MRVEVDEKGLNLIGAMLNYVPRCFIGGAKRTTTTINLNKKAASFFLVDHCIMKLFTSKSMPL